MLVKHLVERANSNFHYRILAFDPFCSISYTGDVISLAPSVEVVRCPVNEKRLGLPMPGFIGACLRVSEQVAKYKPNIIHSHISSWLLGTPRHCKRILTLHSYKTIGRKPVSLANDFLYVKLMPLLTRSFVDHYTCVGDILKKAVQKDIDKPVTIIGNPIDEAYFTERKTRVAANKILTLVTCALLSRRKHIHKAIELTAALKLAGNSAQLRIIGPSVEPDYYKELQELVTKLSVKNEVVFVGRLNRESIAKEYNLADIGVFFSEQETFGLAPLEMLAAGLPLLTTSVGVLDERRAEFEKMGVMYVDLDDRGQQVKAISQLKNSNTDHIVDFIKKEFGALRVIAEYENLYESVTSVK